MTDRTMTAEQQNLLETLVDACGLDLVIEGLATVCAAKSDHTLVNWQDRKLADAWMKAMTQCDRLAVHKAITTVSA